MPEHRLVVIGAGLAGAAAAALARQAGIDVTLIYKDGGATAFSSGALDVAGDVFAPLGRLDLTERNLSVNLERLILADPAHPYARIAAGQERPTVVLDPLKEVLALLFSNEGPLLLDGGLDRNQPCFTTLGTIKFTALYPAQTAQPGLPGMEQPLVLGIRGLADFEPGMWGKVAQENAARLGHQLTARPAEIRLPLSHHRPAPAIADEINRDPTSFLLALKNALPAPPMVRSIVLPPVLPLQRRTEVLAGLADELNLPVYEVLSLPPSVPGLRLHQHLLQKIRKLGVQTIHGEVCGFVGGKEEIKAIRLRRGGGEEKIPAAVFVLASGKFLAGGLRKERAFAETIFNLPVTAAEFPPGREIFTEKLLGLRVNAEHPLFAAGLSVDHSLQLRDHAGRSRPSNLFAAGAILAGHNYLKDGTGAGVALASGALAGKNAACLLHGKI